MRKIKCPVCQEEKETFIGDYHYLESGLDNVWLCGIEIFRCSCGESPLIPSPIALHDEISRCLVQQESILSGPEIRFLRKRMALTGRDLAKLLGVDNATVSRWENGKEKPSEQADRLIRLLYANRLGLDEVAHDLAQQVLNRINSSHQKSPIRIIPGRHGGFSCKPACS